ncbi:MAG TPA: helicase-associated domain-containing protein [Actinoplanes sp.]|nr:helicase-associated domain-containing protein [Actinoplanes sp.]
MATTFADQLRSLPDEALSALIQLRPDLVVPMPADISAVAVRAQSRGSVARCLDELDEFTLHILDAARLSRAAETGLTSVDAILALASLPAGGAPAADVRAAVARLRARFLLYGHEDALHVVNTIDEVSSPYPAGLGRPADYLDASAAALCADAAKLRRTLLAAPPAARALLDRLAAGPPVGALTGAPMADPVRWLVDHHVLVPVSDAGRAPRPDGDLVELPREIGMLLRRDTGPLGALRPQPPAPEAADRDPKAVDSAGAGQAMEVVRHVESMLETLAAEPAPVLRSGGLGVRDLRRLARAAAVDEPTAALLLEAAYAAGLLGEADRTGKPRAITSSRTVSVADEIFLPTGGYDLWRTGGTAARWELLARSWLAMSRLPGLVGDRDERDRPINVLSPEAERPIAASARREVLDALAALPAGAAPGVDEVLGLLAWRTPRRSRGREAAHRDALAGAARLGVIALGALTGFGRALLTESGPPGAADEDPLGVRPAPARPGTLSEPARTLDALLPAPVDHVLVQADLSVVVPGPPEPELAEELQLVAEPESAGGASVHRVTAASVRRALDAGYSASDLHALFKRRSRTPVPQALSYLIDDAARTHGGLRIGSAGAYLRSDDEALLAEVLADRRLAGLALRRLAPTVLCTPYQVQRLLAELREAGFAPVAEDAVGAAVLSRPKARRAPARTAAFVRLLDQPQPPQLTGPRLAGVVEQIRRGDAQTRLARRAPVTVRAANGQGVDGLTPVQAHSQAMAVLQQAVREKALVWVGYVDSHGATLSRLVRPVSIRAGYLRADDERSETQHTFALHRITAVVPEQ